MAYSGTRGMTGYPEGLNNFGINLRRTRESSEQCLWHLSGSMRLACLRPVGFRFTQRPTRDWLRGRGSQFESAPFRELTRLQGNDRVRTTTYHPAANGVVERFHCQLKSSLKAHDNSTHWTGIILMVLLGKRAALQNDIGCSIAEPVSAALRFTG